MSFIPRTTSHFPPSGLTSGRFDNLVWNTGPGGTALDVARDTVPRLLDIVREVQNRIGSEVIITSGRRTSASNTLGGGRPESLHLEGLAIDLWVPPEKEGALYSAFLAYRPELYELVYENNPRHLHVSYRRENVGTVQSGPDENFELHTSKGNAFYSAKPFSIGPLKYEVVGLEQLKEDPDFEDDPLAASKPGAFKIGASFLSIAPTSIEVSEMNNIYQIPTARTHGSPFTKDGRSSIVIDFDVTFVDTKDINEKLRHILAQFRRSPFLPIENYFLQSILYPEVAPVVPAPTILTEPYSDAFRDKGKYTKAPDDGSWLRRQKQLDDALSTGSPSDIEMLLVQIEAQGRSDRESPADFKRRLDSLKRIPEYLRKYKRVTAAASGVSFKDQIMVVALRQANISTVPGFPESLRAHFTCDLFNFLPYTNTYAFLQDIGTTIPVFNISRSKVFQNYYRGLLTVNGRSEFPTSYPSMQTHMDAIPSGTELSSLILKYVYMASEKNVALDSLRMIQKYAELARETKDSLNWKTDNVTIARGLITNIDQFLKSPLFTGWIDITSDMIAGSYQYFENFVKTVPQIWSSFTAVWKLPKRLLAGGDMYAFLDNSENIYITRMKNNIPILQSLNDYQSEILREDDPQILELRLLAQSLSEYEFDQSLMDDTFTTLEFGPAAADRSIVTAINASYKPKLLPISLLGYTTPTFQHMGSSEWTISMNIQTDSPSFVQKLRIMNERMNKLALRSSRMAGASYIPRQNNTATVISGPMFSLLGVRHVIPGNFRYSTVEGKPGLTNISIDLVQADVTAKEYEKLSSPYFFSSALITEVLSKLSSGFIGINQSWTTVTRVIDGDTVVLQDGTIVRLIGVDTPESVDPRYPVQPGALAATAFTKAQLEGKQVRVELHGQDKYGRSLGYIFLVDGTPFNKRLIELGYGKVMDIPHDFSDVFHRIHDQVAADIETKDNFAIQEWRSGYREGVFDPHTSRRWNKLFYNLGKPIPRALFSGMTPASAPSVVEFLSGARIAQTSEAGRALAMYYGAGAAYEKGESLIESIYRSRADQLVKELLADAMAYDEIPPSVKSVLGADLLKKIGIERRAAPEPLSAYPDLEIPELQLVGKRLPPNFFYYTPVFLDPERVEMDALNYANALQSLSLTMAEYNGVNPAGEATVPLSKLERTEDAVHSMLVETRIKKMIDSARRVVEFKRQLAKSQVTRLDQLTRSPLSEKLFAAEREKRYWEDKLPGLEDQVGLIDLIDRQDDKSKANNIMNTIARSWGIVTDQESEMNRQILVDSLNAKEDNTLSVARAFPTFKLYFIEKDKNAWVMFDDFYSYGAVKSIRVHSSRESSSSTAAIVLSNISNTINDITAQNPENPLRGGTIDEQNIDTLMLRVGCEIMIRMGYSSTPEDLPIVFQGSIVKIAPGTEMSILAQSWGAELQYPIGAGNEFKVGATSTIKEFGDLASAIISEIPGMTHFGTTYNLAEMMEATQEEFFDDIRARWWSRLRNEASQLLGWGPMIDHRMDNIWLPFNSVAGVGLNSIMREILGGKGVGFDWRIRGKSAWDALQEILHYFPGYIMKVLPYNEKDTRMSRSTLYIGPSTGYYRAEDDAEYIDAQNITELERYVQRKRLWFDSIRSQRFAREEDLKTFLEEKGFNLGQEVFQDAYKSLLRSDNGYFLDLSITRTALYITKSTWDITKSAGERGIVGFLVTAAMFITKRSLDGKWTPMTTGGVATGRLEREVGRKWHSINIQYDLLEAGMFDVYDIYDILHEDEYNRLVGSSLANIHQSQAYTRKPENPKGVVVGGRVPRGYERVCKTHFADSYHHIVDNKVSATSEFANRVILSYPKGEPMAIPTSSLAESSDIRRIELDVDDNIRPDLIRAIEIYEPNIDIDRWSRFWDNVKRFLGVSWNAVASLFTPGKDSDASSRRIYDIPVEYVVGNAHIGEQLRRMYTGELTMLMNPDIQVFDTVYIHDDINQMYGPVGVREVQHVFDCEIGAYTIIVPDLISFVGDMTPILHGIYASKIMNAAVKLSLVPLAGGGMAATAALCMGGPWTGAIGAIGFLGAGVYGAGKIGSNVLSGAFGNLLGRQCGNFIPLWYKNQPFVAGVEGMRKDDFLVHLEDKISTLGDVWRNIGGLSNPQLIFPEV